MVGKSNQRYGKGAPVQAYPSILENQHNLLPLSSIKALPKAKLFPKYIEDYRQLVAAETEFGLKMWEQESPDMFFIYSSALDWLGHNLWSYFDEDDPAYPGDNPHKAIFLEFYKLYDDMVGKFLEVADSNTAVMIFSDHGQTRRPSKLLNINEMLRAEGLLTSRIKTNAIRDPLYLSEVLKKTATRVVNKYGAGALTLRIVHRLPKVRRMFTSPLSIDWDKTLAYVSDLSGIKAYPYGGIMIARDRLKGWDYQELCTSLIRKLGEVKEPGTGESLIEWICHRDDLYPGEHISKYPDIVFQLQENYGVGWAIYDSLIGECQTHNIQPGSHKADTPVFLLSDPQRRKPLKRDITLMDIAPTVLHLLGIQKHLPGAGDSMLSRD
jgi:predicted AlkP superfamily phosphohydrolase/phosphomutase